MRSKLQNWLLNDSSPECVGGMVVSFLIFLFLCIFSSQKLTDQLSNVSVSWAGASEIDLHSFMPHRAVLIKL